jgi:hypothetical protein
MSNLLLGGSALTDINKNVIKTALLLDQVNNTPDTSKPLSAAMIDALSYKADANSMVAALTAKQNTLIIYCTWDTKPDALTVSPNIIIILTDYNYTWWHSNGTYWRPCFPISLFRKITLTTGLCETAEQAIGALGPVPPGMLCPGAVFGLRFGIGRDVNTDAMGNLALRVGASPNAMLGGAFATTLLSNVFTAGGTTLSIGIENWSVMLTNTSCARAGMANGTSSFAGQASNSGNPLLTPSVIPDVTSIALYFCLTVTMITAVASKPQTGFMELFLEA